jgi:DNA (cytosine-5)-methyltransferase 1
MCKRVNRIGRLSVLFVTENVSNLKAVSGGVLYRQILDQMDTLGYNVTPDILLAADFGAPQMRRRLIFLGCRKDIGSLPLPIPHYSEQATLFDKSYITVGEAFDGLPAAEYSNCKGPGMILQSR